MITGTLLRSELPEKSAIVRTYTKEAGNSN